ncbi:hypothetical protein BJ508DRAFT_410492 [Ascobolus immersus RN42]|uniref:Tim17-domain-containing protein n=1 Tax=Ascobolus immersus RN42 TaxID=1160509 RepID=A0A3N4IPU8_ASCIM|nr:hypothetical protein BJ508DRAFT_410492 [Ascobolus immersus RN42]
MHFPALFLLSNIFAFSTGSLLGSALGGKRANLRFIAENSHRKPKSQAGWYLYHKSKNYATMLGAVKEGTKSGLRLCGWVSVFVVSEGCVDRVRGRVDAVGTVVAAGATAGAFSLWNRLSYAMTVRTAKQGLALGIGFGVLQDVLRVVKGEGDDIKYLSWLPRRKPEVIVETHKTTSTTPATEAKV